MSRITAAATAALLTLAALPAATAAPMRVPSGSQSAVRPAPPLEGVDRTEIVRVTTEKDTGLQRYAIRSVALDRTVEVQVRAVPGATAALYLLDGVDAPARSGWLSYAGMLDVFADRPVTLIAPTDAPASMYSDWERDDPALGRHRWETFIVRELPAVLEPALGITPGHRGAMGISMGAQGAMMLAHRNPGHFRAVGALSGCYSTAPEHGRASVDLTVTSRNGDPVNMWGPYGSANWKAHDTRAHVDALRGTTLHLLAGSGIPSAADAATLGPDILAAGMTLEAGARNCLVDLEKSLNTAGVPATIQYTPDGIHAWRYWRRTVPAVLDTIVPAITEGSPGPR